MNSKVHNVVVVGNGSNLLQHKRGEVIDSFDTVVRMGSYRTDGYEEYIGTKTDIFCTIASMFCKILSDDSAVFTLDPGMTSFNFKKILFLEYDCDSYYESTMLDNCWGTGSIPVQISAAGGLHFKKLCATNTFKKTFSGSSISDRIILDHFIEYLYYINKNVEVEYYNRLWRTRFFVDFNNMLPKMSIAVPSKGMYVLDYITKTFKNSKIYVCGFDGFKTKGYWRTEENSYTFRSHSPIKEQCMYKKLLRDKVIYEL